jgi:hypothetical protein
LRLSETFENNFLCGFGEWRCANYARYLSQQLKKNAKPAHAAPFAASAQASARISI